MTNKSDETEIFEKQLIFDYLVEHIRDDKSCISNIGRAFVKEAIEYFDDVQDGFENIEERLKKISIEDEVDEGLENIFKGKLNHQEPLREIFEAINGEEEYSTELILKTIEKIGDAQEQLERMIECPTEFYQADECNELLDLCQKFGHIYESKGFRYHSVNKNNILDFKRSN